MRPCNHLFRIDRLTFCCQERRRILRAILFLIAFFLLAEQVMYGLCTDFLPVFPFQSFLFDHSLRLVRRVHPWTIRKAWASTLKQGNISHRMPWYAANFLIARRAHVQQRTDFIKIVRAADQPVERSVCFRTWSIESIPTYIVRVHHPRKCSLVPLRTISHSR